MHRVEDLFVDQNFPNW